MKKQILIPAVALIMTAGIAYGAYTAQAAETHTGFSFAQRIAKRFNLQESEVQTFMSELRLEHHEMMQERIENRLATLVSEGKLAAEQKDLLLAKFEEQHKEHEDEQEELSNKTPEERRAHMQEERQEMQEWAETQGIDLSVVMPVGQMRHGHWGR